MVGAVEDIRYRRIPNWLTYGAIIVAFVIRTALMGWPGLLGSLLGLVAGAAVLLLMFALGGMGGGDVKLMGAVGAWVGAAAVIPILAAAAVTAAITGIGFMLFRGRAIMTFKNILSLVQHHAVFGLRPHPELNIRESSSVRVPFAPAIALGTLFSVSQTLFWG